MASNARLMLECEKTSMEKDNELKWACSQTEQVINVISSIIISLDEKPTVEIRISDTGKGIHPENLTKIFDPFFTTKPIGL